MSHEKSIIFSVPGCSFIFEMIQFAKVISGEVEKVPERLLLWVESFKNFDIAKVTATNFKLLCLPSLSLSPSPSPSPSPSLPLSSLYYFFHPLFTLSNYFSFSRLKLPLSLSLSWVSHSIFRATILCVFIFIIHCLCVSLYVSFYLGTEYHSNYNLSFCLLCNSHLLLNILRHSFCE